MFDFCRNTYGINFTLPSTNDSIILPTHKYCTATRAITVFTSTFYQVWGFKRGGNCWWGKPKLSGTAGSLGSWKRFEVSCDLFRTPRNVSLRDLSSFWPNDLLRESKFFVLLCLDKLDNDLTILAIFRDSNFWSRASKWPKTYECGMNVVTSIAALRLWVDYRGAPSVVP
jgi:hypothetical protein